MHKIFETPGPTSLYVEVGPGEVRIEAADVAQTTVDVTGQDADEVTVEQRGDQITVVGPKSKFPFFGSSSDLLVRVTLPADSEVTTRLGSADLTATGRLGDCRLKSGSGEVQVEEIAGNALVECGSGDIEVGVVHGSLRTTTGSGDVQVDQAHQSTSVATGSGDVRIGTGHGDVQVKSASGDVEVREAHADLVMSSASGDLRVDCFRRGSLQVKNASGDITVGIPAGVPVWTDISSVSGTVSSTLDGAGQPQDGQDYIELRAKTVSGDVHLEQL
jgi:DUF4097 and DUF4098 domain-containing protein YvlB